MNEYSLYVASVIVKTTSAHFKSSLEIALKQGCKAYPLLR